MKSLTLLGILALAVEACSAGSPPDDVVETTASAQTTGCALSSMYVVGTPRNFGVAPGGPLPMSCVDGQWEVVETFAGAGNVFAAGAFKFLESGSFSNGRAWGDWAPRDGNADLGGDGNDIIIETPGRYKLRFDDRAFRYTAERLPSRCEHASVIANGVSSKDGTLALACVDQGVYSGIVNLSQSNATISVEGRSRSFGASARYLVEYDERSGSFKTREVSPACAKPVAYVRGTMNAWGTLEMECENGHYAITIGEVNQVTFFKFDTKGDFSESYGVFPNAAPRSDGHFEPARNVFGNDIRVGGRHHVHFYNDGSFAFDRHD